MCTEHFSLSDGGPMLVHPPKDLPQVIPAQMRRVNNLISRRVNYYSRQNGVEVAPWPVDGVFDLQSILDMDPVTIVTNRPERLFQMLDPDFEMPEAAAALLADPSLAR